MTAAGHGRSRAPLPKAYTKENLALLEKGHCNMPHFIGEIRKSGINPVVCINAFHTDTKKEIAMVRKFAEQRAPVVLSLSTGSKAGMAPLNWPMWSWMPVKKKSNSNSSILSKCRSVSGWSSSQKRFTVQTASPGLRMPKPKPNGLRPILHKGLQYHDGQDPPEPVA